MGLKLNIKKFTNRIIDRLLVGVNLCMLPTQNRNEVGGGPNVHVVPNGDAPNLANIVERGANGTINNTVDVPGPVVVNGGWQNTTVNNAPLPTPINHETLPLVLEIAQNRLGNDTLPIETVNQFGLGQVLHAVVVFAAGNLLLLGGTVFLVWMFPSSWIPRIFHRPFSQLFQQLPRQLVQRLPAPAPAGSSVSTKLLRKIFRGVFGVVRFVFFAWFNRRRTIFREGRR